LVGEGKPDQDANQHNAEKEWRARQNPEGKERKKDQS
jgi:hypothetical protein